MEKTKISLVIITYNEEANIERCIRSVPFADDVVVLDSGSTDRTTEIARKLGARVRVEPWRGYHKQKVRATAMAFHDWVLSLDADEALSPEAAKELQELIGGELTADAYSFPRISYHLGKWIKHGGWYPDRQIRFFNKNSAEWTDSNVHEHIKANKVVKLKSDMQHFVFSEMSDHVNTINEYSSLRAKDFVEAGKSFSLFKLLFKPFFKFLEVYVFKMGFLDGVPGLINARTTAYATMLRHAKLYESQKVKK